MFMIEIIADFLQNEKTECDIINRLAEKYRLSDFVMVDKVIKEAIAGGNVDSCENLHGCMYCCRDKHLHLTTDSVDNRLTDMYIDFLLDVLSMGDEKEKVKYLLAFHYLGMIEQLTFQLTVTSGAPFMFWGNELSPHGKQEYASYLEIMEGKLQVMIPYISEESMRKYSRIFYQYRHTSHNTKHFSLLEYLLNCERIIGDWEFKSAFVDMIDLFVFRFKAIIVTESLFVYMPAATCKKVIESLVEI